MGLEVNHSPDRELLLMNRLRWMVAACMVGLVVVLLAGVPATSADFSARQLVDHLYSVSGQMPIHTLIVEMEVSVSTSKDKSGPANLVPARKDKLFFKKPNKLRVDSIMIDPGGAMDGKQLTTIRDGVNIWQYISMGQYPVKKGQDQPNPSSWLPFHLQVYSQDSNKQYAISGRDSSFGAPADIVKIIDPSAPRATVTVWIDRSRWVPLCKEMVLPAGKPGDADTVKRILYKDVRKLPDGRFFPFKVEWHEGGVLTWAGVYKAVGINENLPDSLFEPMNRFIK